MLIQIPFTIHFHALENEEIIIEEEHFTVECFKTQHRIECWGFLFREKKHVRKIVKEKADEYNVPFDFYSKLKNGETILLQTGN